MKKIIALASGAAMVLVSSLAAAAPVTAAPRYQNWTQQRDFVRNWCQRNPRDRSCGDFRRHGHNWSRDQYRGWYMSHRHQHGFNPMAAGIFGFVAGAMAGAAASAGSQGSSHVARCEARYRSYDARSDTYLGYDGVRHRCTL
jgi:hypothetical protein